MPDTSLPPFMRRWRANPPAPQPPETPSGYEKYMGGEPPIAPGTMPPAASQGETGQRRVVSRPLGPSTLQLPAIPRDTGPVPTIAASRDAVLPTTAQRAAINPNTGQRRAVAARDLAAVPNVPVPAAALSALGNAAPETSLVLPPSGGAVQSTEVEGASAVTILPGSATGKVVAFRAPARRPGAHWRLHRFVMAGLALVLAVTILTFAPLQRMVAGGTYANWLVKAAGYELPTPTATPSPTPVIYPAHPVVYNANDFICVALPFARLAQRKMVEAGMAHPWHTSLILAQWGVEQGWQMPGYTGYNFGNVGAISGYPTVGGLNVWGSPNAFAYGNTPIQGIEEYVAVSHNGYYDGVTANWGNGPRAQALALGQSPWDAAHYNNGGGAGSSLVATLNGFNLYRFDDPNLRC